MKKTYIPIVIALLTLNANAARLYLSWQDRSANELGFIIERNVDDGGWLEIGRTESDETIFLDAFAENGKQNQYRVFAFNLYGRSVPSNVLSVNVPIDSSEPTEPILGSVEFPEQIEGQMLGLSERGFVGTGDDISIVGLGPIKNGPVIVLIRGVGPTLANFNVSNVLADPFIAVLDNVGLIIATNDNWEDAPDGGAAVVAAAESINLWQLPPGSKDAALVVELKPGSYTIHLSGVGSTTGNAITQAYKLPEQ